MKRFRSACANWPTHRPGAAVSASASPSSTRWLTPAAVRADALAIAAVERTSTIGAGLPRSPISKRFSASCPNVRGEPRRNYVSFKPVAAVDGAGAEDDFARAAAGDEEEQREGDAPHGVSALSASEDQRPAG